LRPGATRRRTPGGAPSEATASDRSAVIGEAKSDVSRRIEGREAEREVRLLAG
jgi:hypothetical protein